MLKKQTVNEDKIQKSKVQAEQSKPQSKDRKMSRGEILKKVFGHLGKYRIFVVFSVLLAAVSVALTLYIPKLIGYAVDEIIGKGAVNFAGIFRILFQIGICTGITALSQWLMNVCNNKMTYQVVQDVRNEDSDPSAEIHRQSSIRRNSKPCYCGCRSVCGRTFDGIYPVVYRSCNDYRHAGIYVVG